VEPGYGVVGVGSAGGVRGTGGVATGNSGQTMAEMTIVSVVHDPPGQTASARPRSTWATTIWPTSESGMSTIVPTLTPSSIQ